MLNAIPRAIFTTKLAKQVHIKLKPRFQGWSVEVIETGASEMYVCHGIFVDADELALSMMEDEVDM